jgi:crotonobetainyl-CoA:carnitine CoA-transferase CaiB-like acyl-CoA transferase
MLLSDVRVVDLTAGYGAFAGRLLADLGAEVVRPEVTAPTGDDLSHLHRNAGKQLVVLDPAAPTTGATLDGLLAGADLAFVSADGAATWPGCSPAAISDRHPHAVVVSVTPWGLTGPASGWQATELVAQAAGGVVYRAGVPELPPVSAPGHFCEDGGAAHAALAGILGVWHTRHGGSGQVIDVSAILALAQCTEMALPLWSMLRNDQVRQGAGAYPLFACSDGLARVVLPMSPGEWRALIAWLGSPPEWTGPEWEQALLGPDEKAKIMAVLPARFAAGTRDELAASGDAAGVRITPVLTPQEVLTNEHARARDTFTPTATPCGEAVLHAAVHSVDGTRAAPTAARVIEAAPAWGERAPTSGTADGTLPLAGIRVLEIGTGVAAPEGSRWLASWGADVVKIETVGRPDFQRRVLGGDMNPAFSTVARDKRILAADLSSAAGRALVDQLLPHVDVIVENNATGVIDRLRLGWDHVRSLNPRIVMVSTQLYGDRGPWAERKGYGPSARAVGGLTWLWAHAPDAPRGVMTIHPDHLAGRLVALGALAALLARERTGAGSRVDLAQCETVSMLLGDLLAAEHAQPGRAQPRGNTNDDHAPWGLYRAADDDGSESWLALTVTDDDAWAALLKVAPAALDRDEWRTESARVTERAAVDAAVAAWVGAADAAQLEEQLQDVGLAASRALHPRLHAAHPHFVDRGFVVEVDQPGNGTLLLEGPCFDAPALATPRNGAAPLPGQHTFAVLRDVLGLDDAELAALVAAGAIEAPPVG